MPSNIAPSFNTSSKTDKKSTSSIQNPPAVSDHSDFINSFLLNNQNVSPATSASSGKSLKEEENKPDYKTEYDSFHADFSSFLAESLTEPVETISDPSNKEQGQQLQTQASHTSGGNSAVTDEKFIPSYITAVNQQTQENSPNTFNTLDKEVSSAQDILSVCKEKALLFTNMLEF